MMEGKDFNFLAVTIKFYFTYLDLQLLLITYIEF